MGVLEDILERMERLDMNVQLLLNQQRVANTRETDTVLNLDGACRLTGYTRSGLYKLTRSRAIPHYKRDGRLMFRKSEIEQWMLGKRVATRDEINHEAERYVARHRMEFDKQFTN